jgi:transposase
MEKEQQRVAKGQMIAFMQGGSSWQEAATMAGVQISRSAAYRLLRKVRTQGETGLQDGRHGHPAKLREPVLQWLKDYCWAAPSTPSHEVQQALENRFGIRVSVSHLNATRAALGLPSRMPPLREKN